MGKRKAVRVLSWIALILLLLPLLLGAGEEAPPENIAPTIATVLEFRPPYGGGAFSHDGTTVGIGETDHLAWVDIDTGQGRNLAYAGAPPGFAGADAVAQFSIFSAGPWPVPANGNYDILWNYTIYWDLALIFLLVTDPLCGGEAGGISQLKVTAWVNDVTAGQYPLYQAETFLFNEDQTIICLGYQNQRVFNNDSLTLALQDIFLDGSHQYSWGFKIYTYAQSIAVLSATAITRVDILSSLDSVLVQGDVPPPPPPPGDGLADTPWPMFRHDPQHSGRSDFLGAAVAAEKWSFHTGDSISSSPAIGPDGTIYVGSSNSMLYAFNPNGTIHWTFATGLGVISSPAIGADGTVFVGSNDMKLYAINPDGSLKWSFSTGGSVDSSPAIGADGTIYVGSTDGKLFAINPDGTLKWSFDPGTPAAIQSSPALSLDSTIYIGSIDGNLYAINPNGTLSWSFAAGESVYASPAIDADGTIYVGTVAFTGNNFFAINPSGTLRWSFDTGNAILSSAAIAADGTIYAGTNDGKLFAINADGSLKWVFTPGGSVDSSPAIGADGTIYVGSGDYKLYAINPDGTLKWSFTTAGGISSSPAIDADGTIYVGSRDGKFYAIGEGVPDIDVAPVIIEQTLASGQTATAILTVSNRGTGQLEWSLAESPAVGWLSESPTSGTVAPGGSQGVDVIFDSSGLMVGDYTTTLNLTSNDQDEPTVLLTVILRVEAPPAPPVRAETAVLLGQDKVGGLVNVDDDGATGVGTQIVRVYDPATNADVPILLGSYLARLTYDGSGINVLEVRGVPPWDPPTPNIDNTAGQATFYGDCPAGCPYPTLNAFAPIRLVGSVLIPYTLTLEWLGITDVDGWPITAEGTVAQTFHRGDVKTDGAVGTADALFARQYLVGLRELDEVGGDPLKANPINMASIRWDTDPVTGEQWDVITSADVLFLRQYLVGLRDELMNLI